MRAREKEKVRWSVRESREKVRKQILVGIVGRGKGGCDNFAKQMPRVCHELAFFTFFSPHFS